MNVFEVDVFEARLFGHVYGLFQGEFAEGVGGDAEFESAIRVAFRLGHSAEGVVAQVGGGQGGRGAEQTGLEEAAAIDSLRVS